MPDEATSSAGDMGRRAHTIYLLYLAGIFLGLGVITIPIAIIMTFFELAKRNIPQWVRSHYWFQLRNIVLAVLSVAAVGLTYPGVDAGVSWATSVMLVGAIGLVFSIIRLFFGVAILYRHDPIPAWFI